MFAESSRFSSLNLIVFLGFLIPFAGCSEPKPKEIPEHRVVPAGGQGEFKAGEPFKVLVEPGPNVLREDAVGVSFSWKVEGECGPVLQGASVGSTTAEIQVPRVCGPEDILVTVTAKREGKEKTFSQVFKPKPIARLYGVQPISPKPRPENWRVVDDFDESPTTKKTPAGTALGVWNFDGAKCAFSAGKEKGTLKLDVKLAGAKSACGIFINLAEDEKGKAKAGSIEGSKALTVIVRGAEKEVPFALEVTEFDGYAAHNQGMTLRSKTFLAAPESWRRHEVDLKRLLKGLDFKSIRQLGLAVDRKMLGKGDAVLEIDLLGLIKG